VEGEKEWGNFLKSGNSSIGGGVTINKWLRDGKRQSSGGRGGSYSANIGTTARRTTMDAATVGVNVGQPVQHARFGRVKVIRDVRGKGFIFQTATANPMHQVAAYDGEAQWVPFVINFESLARPLINSDMGQRAILERSNNITAVLHVDAVNTPSNSALIVRNSVNGSAAETVTTGSTSKSTLLIAPNADVTEKQMLNSVATGSGTKTGSVAKKRMRVAQGGNESEAEVDIIAEEMVAHTPHVTAPTPNLKGADKANVNKKGAGNDIAMHTNPLFDVDIVMAATGNQACQNK
jgi:hypothetical protein